MTFKESKGSIQRPRYLNEVTCASGEPSVKEMVGSEASPRPGLVPNNMQYDFFLFRINLFDENSIYVIAYVISI